MTSPAHPSRRALGAPAGVGRAALVTLALVAAGPACGADDPVPVPHGAGGAGQGGAAAGGDGAGVLLETRTEGRVGVLLDELPEAVRARVAGALVADDPETWRARARRQLAALTDYALFDGHLWQLPPAEVWSIALDAAGPARGRVGAHDVVSIAYHFEATLLGEATSATEMAVPLATAGDSTAVDVRLPIDPDLVAARVAGLCLTDDGFRLPFPLCLEVVDARVGLVETTLHLERLPWDPARADAARVGEVTYADGADLEVLATGLERARVSYRYFPPTRCALAEQCVGAPGWRRLLEFDAAVHNRGGGALHVGAVIGSPLEAHNVYELSECHGHYHFMHYGDYTLGDQPGDKRAFCLVSSARYSNNETTPLATPYDASCAFQGISPGWGDVYGVGLDCQWIDITDVDTSRATTLPLTFRVNPDAFLCEGQPTLDPDGTPLFEPTDFVTETGAPVDRPACTFFPGWDANDTATRPIPLPARGAQPTEPCPLPVLGPNRDCGFTETEPSIPCPAGQPVTLSCTTPDPDRPQALRVCETSTALGVPIPCDALHAVSTTVLAAGSTAVTLTCPEARSGAEPGGAISLFTAPLFPADGAQPVTCTLR
ncbi:MAG: lysyl oxidase family protein [Polyangiaceae bacterium]